MNLSVDWKVFEYKFSANTRAAFEELAYILFCYEFKQNYGIFRYRNQPYIETQPVDTGDGHKVGFQAKYYDAGTSVASKEAELEAAIEGAWRKYEGLDRLIFYINKEFSASSSKEKEKPEYQVRIEKYGRDRGIEIEWRVQSHLEKMLLLEEFSYVRDRYFNPEPGLDRFYEDIMSRKNSVLRHIHSAIRYGDKEVKVPQNYQKLMDFQESDEQVLILYGDAGTGKSAVIKEFLMEKDEHAKDEIALVFSAGDLDVKDETLFLKDPNYRLKDLFGLYKNEKYRLCVIDSAEKYSTARYPQVFESILHQFLDHGWKVILTIRTFYKDSFCHLLLENYTYSEHEILKLEKNVLSELSTQYQFLLPADAKLQELLCKLFYLNLYLNLRPKAKDAEMNVTLFREEIWSQVIRRNSEQYDNLPAKREAFIEHMVRDMLLHERYTYLIKATDDAKAVEALEASGIIAPYQENREAWMMGHDVYEEIVSNHMFTRRLKYEECSGKMFFDGLGDSLRGRKMYRTWLEMQLADSDNDMLEFLTDILQDEDLGQEWKDETLIALMNSESDEAESVLHILLSQPEDRFFTRILFMLNTACKGGINPGLLELLHKQEETGISRYRFTRPSGPAWKTLLRYIYENRNWIPWSEENIPVVTEALDVWTQAERRGETTRAAGLTALYLRKKIYEETSRKYQLENNAAYKKLDQIILNAAMEIKEELKEIFEEVLREEAFDHRTEYASLIEKAASNVVECGMIGTALPELLAELLSGYWKEQNPENMWETTGLESHFGLKAHLNYYPDSALQTPVYSLLHAAPETGLQFIVDLLNYASECYRDSSRAKRDGDCQEIEIIFSETEKVKQICSERLWKMYRGTMPNPNVLECVLMALEKRLLEVAKNFPEIVIKQHCMFLLKNSNNVAVTATVLSIVEAYPEKLFDISCILLKTKEIFHYDIKRQVYDQSMKPMRGWLPGTEVFKEERRTSDKLEFRKISFEQVIMGYQIKSDGLSKSEFNCRMDTLYEAIDQTTKDSENWNPDYRYAYYRMDLRQYHGEPEIIERENQKYLGLKVCMPDELVELSKNVEKKREQIYGHMELNLWSWARYEKKTENYQKYTKYEDHPENAYVEMQEILKNENHISDFMDLSAAIYTCVVLLRDFNENLSTEELTYCKAVIQVVSTETLVSEKEYAFGDAAKMVVPELTKMISCEDLSADWENPMFLLLGTLLGHGGDWKILPSCVAEILWVQDRQAAWKILFTYVHLYPIYRKNYQKYERKDRLETFLEENKNLIEKDFAEEIEAIDQINTDTLSFNQLLFFHELLNKEDEGNFAFVIRTGQKIWGRIFDKDTKETGVRRNYQQERAYVGWLADYALDLSPDNQSKLVRNLMPCICMKDTFASWIWEMTDCEVQRPRYAAFWNMWKLLQPYIFRAQDTKVIKNYLMANGIRAEKSTSWDSLKHERANFYRMAAVKIGAHPATLYSVSYVLNSIGKDMFSKEGLEWLYTIISSNSHLGKAVLPNNTQYYIEEYMNDLIKREKFTLRTDERRRKKVMAVLNFLVSRGSTMGFLMREEII
ncbi:hypothetical protein [Blautia sp. MSJ-19]|uniref:hypothetical protein n=1 Tax=Blautia sp. MSJ-19 TaxID=2841517 RepID=UPI001C0EB88D|nr:hypothetical protein [Blautia sp. MSJ-19]MBU5480131.1 hypothetical protein [Blautia sp. MSJ-19]